MTVDPIPAAVSLHHVTAGYGDRIALTDVDLDIPTGSLLAVIGPNGSGKSTLLKTISGVLAPFSGSVEIFGGPAKLSAKRIAYVPQAELVDWSFPVTVGDVVMMGRVPLIGIASIAAAAPTARRSRRRSRRSGWPTSATARSVPCRAVSAGGCSSPRRSPRDPTCICSTSR